MKGRSFISKLKRKVRNIINVTNYRMTKNYDILVFVITQIYVTLTKDIVGASILRQGQYGQCLQDITDIISQLFNGEKEINNETKESNDDQSSG